MAMGDLLSSFRMDKTALSVVSLGGEPDDREFWASKTPAERLAAVEFLRQVQYGYDPAATRLQRILEITQLERR